MLSGREHGFRMNRQRKLALWAVVAAVLLGHALLTRGVMRHMAEAQGDDAPRIERMQAELVADMKLTAPPIVAPLPPPAEQPQTQSQAPEPPASAASKPTPPKRKKPKPPEVTPSQPLPEPVLVASAPEAPTAASEPVQAAASAATTTAEAEPAKGPVFEWPKATRVTFRMEGYLRGPIHGSSLVEWVRQDNKYQVHVDAYAGPSFAPLASQRWTSEGVITPKGLLPSRFESVNKLLVKSSTPKVVLFEDKELVMPGGERLEKLTDVQDPASHYIQMAYELMQGKLTLEVGKTIEMPVADTRKQRMLVYDVDGTETLLTPLGMIETYKLRPRTTKTSKGEDVMAELWIAPALQYLPIRMLIRIGDQTYFDMQMDKAPQQSPADAADTGDTSGTKP